MIPLLSGKPFSEFSAAEFKLHVKSLYHKPAPRSGVKLAKPFTWTKNKKGTLVLRVNRDPQWLSEEEMKQISKESGTPLSEIFITLKKRGIKISTLEAERKIKLAIEDLPF